jgi:hypothetical protein
VQFTVTASDGTPKGGGQGTARPDGWLNAVGCNCDMLPGDHVHVTSSAGFDAVLVPITIGGQIDVVNDLVWGQMSGGTFPGTGFVWVWSNGRQQGSGQDISIASDGKYSANFAGSFDIRVGDTAEVWYNDANGNQVGTVLSTLSFDVNYRDDWLDIMTAPNAAITVTVAGKASMHVQADASGRFQPNQITPWVPARPDIAPGDTVTVESAGYTSSVSPVGTISAKINPAQSTVVATITGVALPRPLRVRCDVWSSNGGPWVDATVQADGSYLCDFKTVGWSLRAGPDVAVRYFQPDGDAVINLFQLLGVYLPVLRR